MMVRVPRLPMLAAEVMEVPKIKGFNEILI